MEHNPQELQAYYEKHWRDMGMTTEPRPYTKIKVLFLLAESCDPISSQFIAETLHEDMLVVQEVLEEWKQFLHEQQRNGQICYSMCEDFREFLARWDIIQASGMTIQDIKALTADYILY